MVLEEVGRRAGEGYSRIPAVPGREPEPGRVTLALAEKSSQGRVRVSERPGPGAERSVTQRAGNEGEN